MAGAVAALLASGPYAMAQAVFGQILGTVTDPTGAAIPNATIVVTDVSKGTTVTFTSNGAGEFTVGHLIPDHYNVKISAAGFKGYEAKDLQSTPTRFRNSRRTVLTLQRPTAHRNSLNSPSLTTTSLTCSSCCLARCSSAGHTLLRKTRRVPSRSRSTARPSAV
jgi:hypothetical protein